MNRAIFTVKQTGHEWSTSPCDTVEEAKVFLKGISGGNYEANLANITIRIEPIAITKHPNDRMSDKQHLMFIYKRLIHKYGEKANFDFMIRFNKIIEELT